ncbi:histidine kinase [Niabella yanshanensis]|uniref:Histidine kinase n=1 Tax=Niabella yanshanensis TaxID=577386 RepID=A0ABZ0W4B4_9BACT|nr:histidine kinase [Niabella yanshanensis]WQD38077.1 histidine kinase [Niabella yanshanensis]
MKISGQWSFKPNYYQYDGSVLGTNTVYRLLEDSYGFIWMVSDKGILIFNGKSFETLKIPGDEQEIVNICRYQNKLYASSYAGKLYEVDMLTLAINEVALPAYASRHATPFTIMNVLGNKLYLSKSRGAFLILDLSKKKLPVLQTHSDYFIRYLLHGDLSAIDYRFSSAWIRFQGQKIFADSEIYELQNKNLKTFYTAGKDSSRLKKVSSFLREDKDLYVGFLQSGGLIKYKNYSTGSDQNKWQSVLPNVEVGDLLKDSKGNIWISTLHDGVFVFIKEEQGVQKFTTTHKLHSNDTWYIKYKKRVLDIGYKQLVVDQFKNGRFHKKWIGDTTSNFNPVMLFQSYREKAVMLGSNSNFITGKAPSSLERKIATKDRHIYNGEIYTTNPGAIMKFTSDLNLKVLFSDTSQINFYTMLPLSDSVYIKGGANGMYINNTPTKIKAKVSKVRKYDDDILACTDEGLYIKRGEKYFLINEKKGLPDNQCMQIEYFGDQYYQLLTKNGLAYIDKKNGRVAGSFNAQLLGSDIIIHHFDVENDTIWLATNKGVFALNEQLVLSKTRNNISAYLYPDKLTDRVARYTEKKVEFQYNEEKLVRMIIEILDFTPKSYYITYQIEKDNKIIAGPGQVADRSFYVNTAEPGNYNVKLSIGSDKNHVYQTLNYALSITPLWHQTLWFRSVLGIVVAFILWQLIRWVVRYSIKGKEKKINEQYAMLQLQSQAFFSQLNPHFVFNALTPLQSHILKNEKLKSLEYLDRFSSLMRDILKNSDKMETTLKKELDFIKKYIAIQQIRFTPPFSFGINIETGIDQENISIPAMMLQPIIENAIEHGVKNMGTEGKIAVDIRSITIQAQDCLQVQIIDNGVGITQNILKEGHALYILQKRVQTLQKRKGLIASLTHETGENERGTIFKLILSKTKNLWTP